MNITIIGVGLIGGSLARSLRKSNFAKKVYGVDKSATNLEKAIELGIIDEAVNLDTALKNSKVIILAIPVDGIKGMLPTLMDKITKNHVIMDMGSTKVELLNTINKHANRGRLVA